MAEPIIIIKESGQLSEEERGGKRNLVIDYQDVSIDFKLDKSKWEGTWDGQKLTLTGKKA